MREKKHLITRKVYHPPKKTSCQWYHPSDTGPRAQLPLAAVVAVSASGTSPWHRLELQSPGFVQIFKSPRFSTSFKGYVSYIPVFKRQTNFPNNLSENDLLLMKSEVEMFPNHKNLWKKTHHSFMTRDFFQPKGNNFSVSNIFLVLKKLCRF